MRDAALAVVSNNEPLIESMRNELNRIRQQNREMKWTLTQLAVFILKYHEGHSDDVRHLLLPYCRDLEVEWSSPFLSDSE